MHPFQCETVHSDRMSGFVREAFIWRCNGPAPSLHSPSPFGRGLGRGSKANTALVPLPPPLLPTGEGGKHPSLHFSLSLWERAGERAYGRHRSSPSSPTPSPSGRRGKNPSTKSGQDHFFTGH